MVNRRLQELRTRMEQIGLDGFLITKAENRKYISGFSGTAGVILITSKNHFLLTDFRYMDQAKTEAPLFQLVQYQAPFLKTLKDLMDRLPLEKVGFESDHLTYHEYQEFASKLNRFELLPQKGLVEQLRMVKDPAELALIREAAKIADQSFNNVLQLIKPGIREREIAVELEYQMALAGATSPSFTTIVASGQRSSLPHGVASDKAIEKGDLITIDFGCIYRGYCSDMTRTVVVGQPTDKQREVYGVVQKAQALGLETIRAGLGAKEVDEVSRSYIASQGYGQFFGHGLGHGLGINVHENPSLSPRDNTQLLGNMVVTIEPGIYIPEWGGVRIEDLVIVLEGGHENLIKTPKELIIL